MLSGDLGISIRCSSCDRISGHQFCIFRQSQFPFQACCLCSKPLAHMAWTRKRYLVVTVHCHICGESHRTMFMARNLMQGSVATLHCAHTNVELGFVGYSSSVSDVAQAWHEELASVPAAMHNRIEPFARAMISQEILEFLHRLRGLRAGARIPAKGKRHETHRFPDTGYDCS